ncbi:MAG: carbonic anhydrase [Deltaproteobacteria bacterium]
MSDGSAFSRRRFLQIGGAGVLGAGFIDPLGNFLLTGEARAEDVKTPKNGDESLKKLMEGNKRFVNATKEGYTRRTPERREITAQGQNPFAVILACADSRVAPEILFDQGIGDLFVVRVAGNIVNPQNYGIKGSIEFGVKALGANLIMVLGHSACGAVAGAIQALESGTSFPGSIENIVKTIEPAVKKVKGEPGDLLENSIVSNVKFGVRKLNNSEPVIAPMVKEGKVKIVGGNYDLKTGEVTIVT